MFHCHFPQKIGWMDGERWEHFLESRAGTFSVGFIIVGPIGWVPLYMYQAILSIVLYRTSLKSVVAIVKIRAT